MEAQFTFLYLKLSREWPEKHLFVHVYCVCHLPESYDTNMIQCDQCGSWFHLKCMGLRKNALPDTWFCVHCK